MDEECLDYENRDFCYNAVEEDPVVINRFNGVKYCGQQIKKPFSEMQRPALDPNNPNKYKCPEGFSACNPEFLA